MLGLGVLGVVVAGSAFGQDMDIEAQEEPVIEEEVLGEEAGFEPAPRHPLAFARDLRELNQDETAYAEYLRVAAAHPASSLADQALYEAGRGALPGIGGSHHFLWAAEKVRPELRGYFLLLSQKAIYLDVVTLWGGDKYTFEESMSDPDLASWMDPQAYMRGWIQLVDEEYSAAIESFGSIEDPTLKPRSQELAMAIEARDLPRRSKVVAGIISSLLPGSGQLYGGEIEDGVTAMIVTGLAGLGTWYAYRDDQYLWTGVAGLGAVALYVKQIGDGVRAADNFNTQKLEDWRHELHASSVLHVDLSEGEGETLELEIELGEIE